MEYNSERVYEIVPVRDADEMHGCLAEDCRFNKQGAWLNLDADKFVEESEIIEVEIPRHQCKYGLNTSTSDLSILVCINTMINDRDQQIRMLFLVQQFRMLFLTQQVELARHGCVRQEIARVKQKSHCYQNARGTRDHTCQNKKSYFSEYAGRHEIARVRTESHFPEYAVRHEIARVRNQRCKTAISRQHDR